MIALVGTQKYNKNFHLMRVRLPIGRTHQNMQLP